MFLLRDQIGTSSPFLDLELKTLGLASDGDDLQHYSKKGYEKSVFERMPPDAVSTITAPSTSTQTINTRTPASDTSRGGGRG